MKNTVDKVSENTKKSRQHLKYLLSTIVKIVKHRRTSGKKNNSIAFRCTIYLFISCCTVFYCILFVCLCV